MELLDIAGLREWALALLLGMARLTAVLGTLPLYARQSMPPLVRVGIAAALTLPAVPMLMASVPQEGFTLTGLVLCVSKEVLLGSALGWLVSIPFWVVEGAGFIISNQYGAAVAAAADPLTGNESSPLGSLLLNLYVALFLIAGGLDWILRAFYTSYQVWPAGAMWPRLEPGTHILWLQMFDSLLRLAVLLSAPATIAMLVAELTLAMVSMFAPRLPVFFIAMPVKATISLLMLTVYLRIFMAQIGTMAPTPLDMLRLMQQAVK